MTVFSLLANELAGMVAFLTFLALVFFLAFSPRILNHVTGGKLSISFASILVMGFRGIDPSIILGARYAAARAGIDVPIQDLVTHHQAGGHVPIVIKAMIDARKVGIDLTFENACRLDIEGQNLLQLV